MCTSAFLPSPLPPPPTHTQGGGGKKFNFDRSTQPPVFSIPENGNTTHLAAQSKKLNIILNLNPLLSLPAVRESSIISSFKACILIYPPPFR